MKNLLVLFLFLSCNSVFAQPNLAWKSVAPGVWSAKVGKPDPFNFYTAIQTKPRIGALQLMEAVNFPLPKNDIKATIIDGKTYEALYGSRNEVWDGKSYKTTGGLTKSELITNKRGKIISRRKSIEEKINNKFETIQKK